MIPSFHAVFGLRHRDKTAKVIDYKGQVIRAQGITSFYGAPLLLMVIVGLRGYAIIIILGQTPANGISPKYLRMLKKV